MRRLKGLALCLLVGAGCSNTLPVSSDAGAAIDAGTAPPADSVGATASALSQRLAGLWSGSATQTVLGTFPLMNVDFRPADGHVLFGRTDLDPGDSLRFGFMIETFGGGDTLVYRNGGYFQGLLRDMRATLTEHDESRGYYRFCHQSGGCGYIDARFTFADPQHLTLDVKVKGNPHLLWQAERRETRDLPRPYPVDSQSQGPGTAPFPTMPALTATVSWPTPLKADADVWLLLSTTACVSAQSCTVSRSLSVAAAAGASSATLTLDQLHAGSYFAVAVVDRNRNLRTTLAPAPGDSLSNPFQSVDVAAHGTTSTQLTVIRDL
jgi:hypothetical protein